MAEHSRADDRDSATDVAVYLPAGITPPTEAGRFSRLWKTLFRHRVEPPK